MTFGRQQSSRFLDGMGMEERTYSEETARAIDAEVKAILMDQHRRATEILTEKRDVLERMTRRLLEVETLDRKEIERVIETTLGAGPDSYLRRPAPGV
jgi:cell division protease FtsH